MSLTSIFPLETKILFFTEYWKFSTLMVFPSISYTFADFSENIFLFILSKNISEPSTL